MVEQRLSRADGGTLLQVTADPEPVVAPPYPTGRRRHNRIGVLGLVLAVLAAVVAAFSVSAIGLGVVAGALSLLGTRRPHRPTSASWVGLGFSVAAVVIAVAAG